jgi:hypothetical protein
MAGFSIKDIPVAKGNDTAPQLQRLILEAWDIIKKPTGIIHNIRTIAPRKEYTLMWPKVFRCSMNQKAGE